MKRRLFTILSALSLLLAIAAVLLWIESCRGFVRVSPGDAHIAVRSENGRIGLFRLSPLAPDVQTSSIHADFFIMEGTPAGVVPAWKVDRVLTVPYWSVIGPLLIPCGICALAYQRYRQAAFRRIHGLCLTCGYDLRASKERCPECGTPIPAGIADLSMPLQNAGRPRESGL